VTLTPGKVNQGRPAPNANAWPITVQGVAAGLALPIVGSAPAQSTATWTSATALNTALTYTGLAPYGAVTIGVTVPTTVTAGAVTIETSLDGTNWTQAGSVRVDNSVAENVVPLAFWPGTNGTRQYLVSLDALTQIRVRLSTVITGTGNVVVIIAPAQQGVEPLVATRARKVPTFSAVYRVATGTIHRLSNVFAATGRKQYATIHHAATATKTVRLRKVWVGLDSTTAAAVINIDLVRITTAPATGNPAITPSRPSSADAAAEATCLALPTTAATESDFHSTVLYNASITAAGPTAFPPTSMPWIDLLAATPRDDETKPPEIRAGVLEGWAVTFEPNTATTLTGFVLIEFTEEGP
jgi:hypothetical protein